VDQTTKLFFDGLKKPPTVLAATAKNDTRVVMKTIGATAKGNGHVSRGHFCVDRNEKEEKDVDLFNEVSLRVNVYLHTAELVSGRDGA